MDQSANKKKIFQGRYEILSIIGRGSSSVVYHARLLEEPYSDTALKVLINKKELGSLSDRLRKEALALVSARNRYVIRLDDFHSIGTLSYLAMEYAPKADLRSYWKAKGTRLPIAQSLRFISQMAEALSFIHQTGMLHRDIKPDNILVMSNRESRLGDFGVALLPGEKVAIEDLQKGIGTMDYMAPEVFEGNAYTAASDVYQLAVTAYELLEGSHPFSNIPLAEVLKARKDNRIKKVTAVDQELANVIMKGLRYDAEQRYQNCKEFAEAFNQALEDTKNKRKAQKDTITDDVHEKESIVVSKTINAKTKNQETTEEPSESDLELKDKQKRPKKHVLKKTSASKVDQNKSVLLEAKKSESANPFKVDPTKIRGNVSGTRTIPASAKKSVDEILETDESQSNNKNDQPEIENSREAQLEKEKKDFFAFMEEMQKRAAERQSQSNANPVQESIGALSQGESKEDRFEQKSNKNPFLNDPLESDKDMPFGSPFARPSSEKEGNKPNRDNFDFESRTTASEKIDSQTGRGGSDFLSKILEQTYQEQEVNEEKIDSRAKVEKKSEDYNYKNFDYKEAAVPVFAKKPSANFLKIFIVLALAYVGYSKFIAPRFIENRFGPQNNQAVVTPNANSNATDANILLTSSNASLAFPNLPSGTYSGEISNLIPGVNLPLAFLSEDNGGIVTLMLGVSGWQAATIEQAANANELTLRANGYMLKFNGSVKDGALTGDFTNLVNGAQGTWYAKTVLNN